MKGSLTAGFLDFKHSELPSSKLNVFTHMQGKKCLSTFCLVEAPVYQVKGSSMRTEGEMFVCSLPEPTGEFSCEQAQVQGAVQ